METDERAPSEFEDKFGRDLPLGLGVRRSNLYNSLGDQLRELWGIESSDNPVLEMVEWHLEWLIAQIEPADSTPALRRAEEVRRLQQVARITFNVSTPEIVDLNLTQRRQWLQAQGGQSPSESQRDIKRVVPQFVDILRRRDTLPSRESVLAELKRRRQPQNGLIARPEYIEMIQACFAAGHAVVCLWGEPGTGKTVLAQQAAEGIAGDRALRLRAGDDELLQDDLVAALMAEGEEPTNWSTSYCWTKLLQTLAARPRSGILVVDDLQSPYLLERLTSARLSVPIIVTCRTALGTGVAAVELREFTESQALDFVKGRLGDVSEHEALSLVRLLGGRPLALDHAVRYLLASPEIELVELVDRLTRGVASGLDLVTVPGEKAESLVSLYAKVLDTVFANEAAHHTLDTFLALTGNHGVAVRDLLTVFMQSRKGGSVDRIWVRSGIQVLAHYGLIREDGIRLFMHPLTLEVLRELRGSALLSIEQNFVAFLLSPEVGRRARNGEDGRYWAWGLKRELLATKDLAPGWKYTSCVDRSTWLAVRRVDGSARDTYLARYEVRPHGVYKLDYRTGERAPVAIDEGRQLYGLVDLVNQAIQAVHFPNGTEVVDSST